MHSGSAKEKSYGSCSGSSSKTLLKAPKKLKKTGRSNAISSCLIGLLIVGERPQAPVQQILGGRGVPHVVAQAVRQLQVLVVRHPALNSPHLLEGLGEAGEKGLQAGVLQGGDIQQAAGQLDVVVGQVLVGGGHLVGLDGGIVTTKFVKHFSSGFTFAFGKNC
jgi:hypothetical protein